MVGLKEVGKFGSHLFCTMTNTNTGALVVYFQEFIVCRLRGNTGGDSLPLLPQGISVSPLLGLEVLLNCTVHSPCSGEWVRTRRTLE
jgi:hypothetical protein